MVKFYTVNGEMVPAESASVKVGDIGLLRGYGAFDFFLVESGQPVFFDDYLDRFFNSAQLMGLEIPFSRKTFKAKITDLIEANGLSDAGIRLLVTGGYSDNGYIPTTPNTLILQYPKPEIPKEKYELGVKLITHKYQRELPEIKTINYVTGIVLLKKLAAAGALEPLYHDGTDISESVRSNFFIITERGTIATPATGILKGVTRKHLLKVAYRHFRVEKRPISLAELSQAKEAFLTSSTKGVLPVVAIDNLKIGDGTPGETTRFLGQQFITYRNQYLDSLSKI